MNLAEEIEPCWPIILPCTQGCRNLSPQPMPDELPFTIRQALSGGCPMSETADRSSLHPHTLSPSPFLLPQCPFHRFRLPRDNRQIRQHRAVRLRATLLQIA